MPASLWKGLVGGEEKKPHKTNHAEAAVGRAVNEFGIKRFVLTQGRWLHSQVGFSLFVEAVGAGVSSQRSAAVKLKYLTTHYSHRSHHFSQSILGTRQLPPRRVNETNPKLWRILHLTERPFSFFLSLPPQKAVNAVGYSGSECHLDTIFLCLCLSVYYVFYVPVALFTFLKMVHCHRGKSHGSASFGRSKMARGLREDGLRQDF